MPLVIDHRGDVRADGGFGKVTKNAPTGRPVAAPYRFDGMNGAQEWLHRNEKRRR
jgi:hypothetical protein